MKQMYNLAAWNWQMARRPYTILCALFAVQQAAVLLVMAAQWQNMGRGLASHYINGGQTLALGAAFVAAGVISARSLWGRGGSRPEYTWLTLPMRPAARLAAQVLTAILLEAGILAWQFILYFLYFWPVRWLESRVLSQNMVTPMPAQRFYEQLARNTALRCLLPTSPLQLLLVVMLLLSAGVMLPCIFVHHGLWRVEAALQAAVAGACLVLLLLADRETTHYTTAGGREIFFAVLAGAVVLNLLLAWFWALHAIRRAETAC